MKLGRIRDGNKLFRHCIHPISFKGNKSIFAYEKMWNLQTYPDGSIHGSLAWERFVPTLEHVHGYGCRLAAGRNAKREKAGTLNAKTRQHYCGAYQLSGHAVRALAITTGIDGVASADISHNVETQEIAHADLKIVLKPGVDEEGTKTAIIDRLWNASSGPLKHTCDCDDDIPAHQSANLAPAPAGEYGDTRTRFLRTLFIIRFRVFEWLWMGSTNSSICNRLWRFVTHD